IDVLYARRAAVSPIARPQLGIASAIGAVEKKCSSDSCVCLRHKCRLDTANLPRIYAIADPKMVSDIAVEEDLITRSRQMRRYWIVAQTSVKRLDLDGAGGRAVGLP